jgi:hypothetical protein
MKNFVKISALGLLLCAFAAPVVHAQDTQQVNKPISIKLGAFLPSDGNVRDSFDSSWLALGADYAFSKTAADTPVLPLAYLDYTGDSKHGVNAQLYGIGVGVRAYPNRNAGQEIIPFYGAGIGLDFLHASGGGASSTTNTQIGGKLELGAELNSGPFLEAEYQEVPQKVDGVRASGFNIMIGDRF